MRGSGTVGQRGGFWHYRVYLPKKAGERRCKQAWVGGFPSEEAARAALTKVVYDMAVGAHVDPTTLTVKDYLALWLRDAAEPNVGAKTLERYREIVEQHLVPAFGATRLRDLRAEAVAAYYARAQRGPSAGAVPDAGTKSTRAKRGLSARTVGHVHRVLRAALKKAVAWELLARNVTDRVTPPRVPAQEMHALDAEQAARLLEAAKGSPLYVPIVLALTAGLRRGEVYALRAGDVNLDAGTLAVARSLEKVRPTVEGKRRTRLAFKSPKTAKSRRTVALLPLAVQALRAHDAEQKAQRMALGLSRLSHDEQRLVIAKVTGEPRDPDEVRGLKWLVKRAKVPAISYHGLRHSHATLMLATGMGVRELADRLGHSTPMLTLNTYGHVLKGQDQAAADRLEVALRKAGTPQGGTK